MVKIKIHALYDHFPERTPKEGEPYIDMYCDTYVKDCKIGSRTNVAMLLEPRSMIGDAYEYVWNHSDYFGLIFTHDSKILQLPQARMLNWADVWLTSNMKTTKGISIITSNKNWCPLHNARIELANRYKDSQEVDAYFGDWSNQETVIGADQYLEPYMFSIIIENDIDEYWYTEKLLNCFSTKTIPIYVGATKINELFNEEGMIRVDDWHDIPRIVDTICTIGLDKIYYKPDVQRAIEDNFRKVEPWKKPWKERFFRDREHLMEDLING